VYETLFYAAMLRLPSGMAREAKLGRVEAVLTGLGLQRCRDTPIGDQHKRGVSGARAGWGWEVMRRLSACGPPPARREQPPPARCLHIASCRVNLR
jgi:hypothetical protein